MSTVIRRLQDRERLGWRRRLAQVGAGQGCVWRYAVAAWPIALVPSLCLAAVATYSRERMGLWAPSPGPQPPMTWAHAASATLLAPLLETLALSGLLERLRAGRLASRKRHATGAAVVALVFALAHGLVALPWFFGTLWSFFVFGWSYLAWRGRSWRHAFIAAAVPHALLNLTVSGALLLRPLVQRW